METRRNMLAKLRTALGESFGWCGAGIPWKNLGSRIRPCKTNLISAGRHKRSRAFSITRDISHPNIIERGDRADSPACSMPRDTTTTLVNVMLVTPPQFRAPLPSALHAFPPFPRDIHARQIWSLDTTHQTPTVAFPPLGSNITAAVATMGTRHVPLLSSTGVAGGGTTLFWKPRTPLITLSQ